MAPLAATNLTTADLFAAVKAWVSIGEMLEYHGLRHHGRSMQCPNFGEHGHGDRSMSVWISSTGRTWRCRGCGQGGSVVDILTLARGLFSGDAVLALCDYAGIGVARGRIPRLARVSLQTQSTPPRIDPNPAPPPPPARPIVAYLRAAIDFRAARGTRQPCEPLQ